MRFLILLFLFHTALFAENNDEEGLIICGVCRNVSGTIDNSIRNMEKLGSLFRDYAVVIYENNSNDDTASKLNSWANANSHVVFLTEKLPSKKLSQSRTVRIASARNKLLEEVRKNQYRKYKYLVMVDLDFQSEWPIEEIVNSINVHFHWDSISANGVTGSGVYFDRFAYRASDYPFGPELIDSEFWTELVPENQGTWFKIESNAWPEAFSAFGGLAIYKTETITKFSYSGTVTSDLKKYYKKIIASLPPEHSHLQKYEKLNGKKPAGSKIKFRKNCREWQKSSDHSIAVCEHVTLHASMALKGYGRFYINPKLVMRY